MEFIFYKLFLSRLKQHHSLTCSGYKNLLRAVEYAGKAGIIGIEYLTSGVTQEKYEKIKLGKEESDEEMDKYFEELENK